MSPTTLTRRTSVGAAAAVVLLVYWWTIAPAISQLNAATSKTAYYNLMVDGWLAGRLDLAKEPDPALATLKNPYSPLENGPYRLHDASYFNGKYYLYFGPTPALVLFLPWAKLTGTYLWHRQAVAIFSSLAFLVLTALLCAVRRRYYPGAGPLAMGLGTLALGLANGIPVMLRRPDLWEVPISCGAMLIALVLAALWPAVHRPQRRGWWLALAAAFYGLAIGARPSLLPGLLVFAVPLVADWREFRQFRRLVTLGLAVAAPLAVAAIALLAFNWARFGNPLEFGQRYQLTAVEDPAVRHFGLDFVPYNFRVYFLAPERWQTYFPFVRGIELPPAPAGHLGSENPFGVLTNLPVLWFALLAPLAVVGRPCKTWVAGTGLLFAVNAFMILCFAGACNRYEVDFLPPLALLAAIGIVFVEHAWRDAPLALWLARPAWVGLVVFSVAVSFFMSVEHWGLFRLRDPASFSKLARLFDRPVGWLEERLGTKYGALEVRLVLPPFTEGRVEPIIVTGSGVLADYLWMRYEDAGHVRIGFEHTSYGGPVSESIPIDYGKEHVFRLSLGSLFPPIEHPWVRTMSPGEVADLTTKLEVQVDDRVVLHGKVEFYDASPRTRWVGANPFAQHLGSRFTGRILAQRTLPPHEATLGFVPGPASLRVLLPRTPVPGTAEPLVVTGKTGAGDILFVRFLGDRKAAIGLDHWGAGGPTGEPFTYDPDHEYELEVKMGSLHPAGTAGAGDPRVRQLEVRLDDRVVLAGDQEFHPATLKQVYFGWNPIGGSTTGERFGGTLSVRTREAPP